METHVFISPQTAFAPAVHSVPAVPEEVCFADLLSEDTNLTNVDLVIAPLIAPGFDALELILLLGDAGFRGRLHVRAPTLPDRLMVQAELRAVARTFGFRVDLVCAA
jgi:hypothetical protein